MKKIVSNIRLSWLIFTFLVFGSLIKLGLWQSNRAVEKEQRIENIAQLSNKQALSLKQVLTLPNKSINDLPISLNGEFKSEIIFLLDNQTNKGQLGYRVLQVFDDSGKALLINLGWVLGSINRQELPSIKPIEGSYQLNGHVRLVEAGILLMEQQLPQNQWPLRVQAIELDKFSKVIGKELLPFVVYLDKTESIGYKKNWKPIVMPPEKHRGYAFQWFSLATAWLALMVWALIKSSRNNNNNNKKV